MGYVRWCGALEMGSSTRSGGRNQSPSQNTRVVVRRVGLGRVDRSGRGRRVCVLGGDPVLLRDLPDVKLAQHRIASANQHPISIRSAWLPASGHQDQVAHVTRRVGGWHRAETRVKSGQTILSKLSHLARALRLGPTRLLLDGVVPAAAPGVTGALRTAVGRRVHRVHPAARAPVEADLERARVAGCERTGECTARSV